MTDAKKEIPKVKGWIVTSNGTIFAESVYVDNKPAFLAKNRSTGEITVMANVELDDVIIRPLYKKECGYKPYEYTSGEIERLKSRTISNEEILNDIMKPVQLYVAAPLRDQVLITGEILITYLQDHVSTVHYPFHVGETESGKSTILYLGGWLAYRCVVSDDWPHADIYNFLGTDEEGAGTICEDEAQDMAKDKEKIRTYKSSYSKGSSKPRIITTGKTKYQVFYRTFCCKWFAGESVPEDKGFRERLVIVYMLGGKPQASLKKASYKEKQALLELRNKILFWKLQNIGEKFPRIDSGLSGRDRELWEDFLSMFHGTKFESQAKETAAYYLRQRGNTIKDSLEAVFFRILKPTLDKSLQIESKQIYVMVTHSDELPGHFDKWSEWTFYPDGRDEKITPNKVANIVQFKFRAEKREHYEMVDGKKKKTTYYVFDEEVVRILWEKYRVD